VQVVRLLFQSITYRLFSNLKVHKIVEVDSFLQPAIIDNLIVIYISSSKD